MAEKDAHDGTPLLDILSQEAKPDKEALMDLDIDLRNHQKRMYRKLRKSHEAVGARITDAVASLEADIDALLEVEKARSEAIAKWFESGKRIPIKPSESVSAEIVRVCGTIIEDDEAIENAIDALGRVKAKARSLRGFIEST